MKYYFQKAAFPVVYLVLTAVTAFAGLSLSNSLMALKIIIGIIDVALYTYFVAFFALKTGEEAMSVRYNNDVTRAEMVRTQRALPIKQHEEYKVWKGFFLGFLSCIPLIILWIVHLTIITATGKAASQVGGFTMLLYLVVIYFFNLDVNLISAATGFYYTALYLPYMVILTGVFYLIGARRTQRSREAAARKLKDIYGEDK